MRSSIRAPFKRRRFLRATAVRRGLTVMVPARLAVVDPVAATMGPHLRLRVRAGTVPEIRTLPARATLTWIGAPLTPARPLVVMPLSPVTTGAAPRGEDGVAVEAGVATDDGAPVDGDTAVGDAAGGRNAARSAPPMAP